MYPQWYPINCEHKIAADVVCMKMNRFRTQAASANLVGRNMKVCKRTHVVFRKNCYRLHNKVMKEVLTENQIYKTDQDFSKMLLKYFSLVNFVEYQICFPKKREQHFLCHKFDRLMENIHVQRSFHKENNIFFLSKETIMKATFDESKMNIIVFNCSSGEYISSRRLENGVSDCISEDDESIIQCYKKNMTVYGSFCRYHCSKPMCSCPLLFYQKKDGGCSPYTGVYNFLNDTVFTGEAVFGNDTNNKELTTSGQETKKNRRMFDLSMSSDCLLHDFNFPPGDSSCMNVDEIPCTFGCSACFPLHKICVYEISHAGMLMYCPSGAHLKNCEAIECTNMFKCSRYYCIPYR